MTGQSLALFDGTGLLVRCSRAAAATGLHAGPVATGSLFFFVSRLAQRLRESSPTHAAVLWDGEQGRYYRTKFFPGYKAGRQPFSGGSEYDRACDACAAAGIFQLAEEFSEADDLIAASWRWARREMPGAEIIIYSDDADLHQLIDEKTVVMSPFSNGSYWDLDEVRERYGCEPDQIPMIRSFSGDRSDGIPGIRGIGPKKARKLLSEAEWKLAEVSLSEEDRAQAIIYYSIMNLNFGPGHRIVEQVESTSGSPFGEAVGWDPEKSVPGMREFLRRYEMGTLLAKLEEGRLWSYAA